MHAPTDMEADWRSENLSMWGVHTREGKGLGVSCS